MGLPPSPAVPPWPPPEPPPASCGARRPEPASSTGPYLMQVLAAVRRNWLAGVPEGAKAGRRGRGGDPFSLSRGGSVPKLVIVTNSGTDALDRAAVAGVSASNPFPPLPAEYKGDRI